MERQLDHRAGEDLRTRMEGQLEVIERAVVAWEAAAVELESDEWHRGAAWLALNVADTALEPAVEALERRVRELPELPQEALLDRLQSARSRVSRAAVARLDSIERPWSFSHPRRPAGPVLAELRKHLPILHVTRTGWRPVLAWSVGLVGLAIASALAAASHHWTGLLFPLLFAGTWLWLQLGARTSARTTVLTSRTLVVGRHSMPLEHLVVEEVPWDAETPRWEIVFRPPGEREVRVRFVERPVELIRRLQQLQVPFRSGRGSG